MTLQEALAALVTLRDLGDTDQRNSARVVTKDGRDFWVEWYGPHEYWRDYQHVIRSLDGVLEAI